MLFELKQRLPRHHLDDTAEHVGRMAVVPARCGLLGERQCRDPVGEFGVVEIAGVQLGIGIELLHQGFAEEAVRDARRVPQQIPDRDRALQRLELERRLSGFIGKIDADFCIRKGGNVFRHGIVERQLAVVDQHHRGNRGDGFRHRIDPEDRVRRHRQAGREVADAETLEIDRLAVLLDQQDRAGNLAGRDFVANVIADPIEGRARESWRVRRFRARLAPRAAIRRPGQWPAPRQQGSALRRRQFSIAS